MTNQKQVEANIAATNAKIEATNTAVSTLVDTLKTQQSAYKSFEKAQAKANAKLHAVLGEAFTAYADLMTDDECVDSKAKINLFKAKVEAQKSKFAKASTAATSLQLRIIRYVCGDAITDKTATNYARVIKVAYANAVQKMDMTFSEWVLLSGGIDNVRATKDGETPKDFLAVGKTICATRNAEAAVEAAADSGHEFSVALVRTNDDGTQAPRVEPLCSLCSAPLVTPLEPLTAVGGLPGTLTSPRLSLRFRGLPAQARTPSRPRSCGRPNPNPLTCGADYSL